MRTITKSLRQVFTAVILAGALANAALWGQTFNSGSTGSDGALAFPNAQPGQTIVFDPTTFTPPLDPAHDNIFNFTTIIIPKGVTIRLSAQNLGGPIYWLASGAVDIEGTLDLSGSQGYPGTNLIAQRIPAIPGAGGFPGGVGGNSLTGSYPVEAGKGPGGGVPCLYNSSTIPGGGGAFTGNQFLVPLVGGSGGAGDNQNGSFGSGGGAGGGAILIASSVSITINGIVTAAGGNSGDFNTAYAGGGAGGAIRLASPTIQGNGSISVAAGRGNPINNGSGCNTPVAQSGFARLEAFNQLFSGSISGAQASGSPYNTFVPNTGTAPKLTVVSVNGVAVAPNPLGNFTSPDVTFSASGPVPVVVNGANIPVPTQVSLQIYSENGPDIVMQNAGVLSGTTTASTVTIMVNLPPGFSRGFISASFTP